VPEGAGLMAAVADVDPDLRALARRVPEDVAANCSPVELRLRCLEASHLLADAETARDEVKAGRLRSEAARLLKAVSPTAYGAALAVLNAEFAEARERGDDRRAWEIQREIREFERRNPQPSPETVLAAVDAAISRGDVNLSLPAIPPPPAGHLWTRRNRRK
jgi:hypothetical protein